MSGYIRDILEHATSQGYKSNVLKPLMWIVIILFAFSLGLFYLNKETPGYIILVLSIIFLLAYGFCYFFCLFKNPDLLRSEKFNLEKTALEKITIGDSTVGKLKLQDTDYVMIEKKGENNLIDKN